MATPTEVLNDDIKELRSDIRENRTKIDLVKEEVQRMAVAQGQMKLELREDIQRVVLSQAEMKADLREDIQRVVLSQAEMKADVRDEIKKVALVQSEMKGEFRFVKLLLSLVLAGIAGSAWQFSGLNARVNTIETRLERLESAVTKILEQTRPSAPARVSPTTP